MAFVPAPCPRRRGRGTDATDRPSRNRASSLLLKTWAAIRCRMDYPRASTSANSLSLLGGLSGSPPAIPSFSPKYLHLVVLGCSHLQDDVAPESSYSIHPRRPSGSAHSQTERQSQSHRSWYATKQSEAKKKSFVAPGIVVSCDMWVAKRDGVRGKACALRLRGNNYEHLTSAYKCTRSRMQGTPASKPLRWSSILEELKPSRRMEA